MSDISMCADGECAQRHTCRRSPESGTLAGLHQSWLAPSPRRGDACMHYWPLSDWSHGRIVPVTTRIEYGPKGAA